MSSKSKEFFKKRVPDGIPEFKSKVARETTSFTWEIKGVEEIRRMGTWEAVHCQFKVSKFTWSLSLSSDDRYLYVVPLLMEPQNAVVKFALTIMVLNNHNNVIYTPIMGGELGYYGCSSGKKTYDQKWEVLKFGETNFDYFSTMVYNSSLKLFVEMTVFYDTHGS
ncbi:unnamed protein product [Orchesella dallaii]|uniref:MATH domain-containing protein n=1 Tax=Orchesella dallaii TaxID=48710 RepID=A0ABP1RDV0_9HEXA